MNKELKNGLKDFIKVGNNICYSINETLHNYYNGDCDLAKYRGKVIILSIDYYSNESLWSNLENQIKEINEILDGE